jgi:hypothetical protein
LQARQRPRPDHRRIDWIEAGHPLLTCDDCYGLRVFFDTKL